MQTPATIDLPVTADDRRVAMLAAVAIGLSLAEAVILSPLPGVKPGLANIVVLIVLISVLPLAWKFSMQRLKRRRSTVVVPAP